MEPTHFPTLPDRDDEMEALSTAERFDVVVVGGGIHGAAVARLCALNQLSVALFERDDYASATSSRSSKMVHGGLRYLEMGDFEQVFGKRSFCYVVSHRMEIC